MESLNPVDRFFEALSKKTGTPIRVSPVSPAIENDGGTFEGHYGFYRSGLVRLETNGEHIVGVSVWNSPKSLNSPDYRVDLNGEDALSELNIVGRLMAGMGDEMVTHTHNAIMGSPEALSMQGVEDPEALLNDPYGLGIPEDKQDELEGSTDTSKRVYIQPTEDPDFDTDEPINPAFLESVSRMYEKAEDDLNDFMKSIGHYGINRGATALYDSYGVWADINDRKEISREYFFDLVKEWKYRNKYGSFASIHVKKGAEGKESFILDTEEANSFFKHVADNENLYALSVVQVVMQKMLDHDPKINAMFVYGQHGEHKMETLKSVLDEEDMGNVIFESKEPHGAPSLLEALWKHRKNKVVVYTGMDKILSSKNPAIMDILKEIMTTEKPFRTVEYQPRTERT